MTFNGGSDLSIKRHLAIGLSLVFVLVFVVGGWAATAHLSGAVVAPGTLVVDSYVKHLKHPVGGSVSAVYVKNGDKVKLGQIVLELDDTQISANLTIFEKRLTELRIREARLRTELGDENSLASFEIEKELDREGQLRLQSERKLFEVRKNSRQGLRAQLDERAAQLYNEISAIEAQKVGSMRALGLVSGELSDLASLLKKGLIPAGRVNPLKREQATLASDVGAMDAQIAKALGQIAEIELQKLQIDADLRNEAATEIREIEQQIGEISERLVAARDELKRTRIPAPQDGVVHGMSVHSTGAVISSGQTILSIVPVSDDLVVEVNIRPQDIDQVSFGQSAKLRLSAFNGGTTPEIVGVVKKISPDLSIDDRTGASFYIVRIAIDKLQINRLGEVVLVPGMPVEAFIQTKPRTALSYLIKPLSDQIQRAFKEE